MDEKGLIRLNRYIDTMPALSITISKVLEVTKNPAVTAKDLNKVISLDPVLVGKVLRLVNSAYYGLSNKVTSLVTAIIMLGINTIKNLALSAAVLGNMRKKSSFKSLNVDGFWRHSIGVGVTSKIIASRIGVPTNMREEYFIGGLLHDIGKIPLNEVFDELYMKSIQTADMRKGQLLDIENEVIGITHCEVGRMIAEKWNIIGGTAECIRFHHDPNQASEQNFKLVASVYIANAFCNENQVGFSGNRHVKKVEDYILGTVGITEEFLDEVYASISSEIEKASIFLQVSAPV